MFSSELSSTFKRLAEDENSKVRRTVASGFHEVRREREGEKEGEGGRGEGERKGKERGRKEEGERERREGQGKETESLVSTVEFLFHR